MTNTEHLYNTLAEVLATIKIPNTQETILSLRLVDGITVRNSRIAISWAVTDSMDNHFVSASSAIIKEALTRKYPDHTISVAGHKDSTQAPLTHEDNKNTKHDKKTDTPQGKNALHTPTVIAIGAGKGGVGKSTTTFLTALALQSLNSGLLIGILDADIYGPSFPTLLNEKNDQKNSGALCEYKGLTIASFGFLASSEDAAIWRGPMVHKALKHLTLELEWPRLDYLLIDLPPGTGDIPISLNKLLPLDGAVLVTTPHVLAQTDTRRAEKMFTTMNVPVVCTVNNMSHYKCDCCGNEDPLFAPLLAPITEMTTPQSPIHNVPFRRNLQPRDFLAVATSIYTTKYTTKTSRKLS